MNLTKEVKDLYKENCKSLKKEIKEDIRKWRDIHVQGLAEWILQRWLCLAGGQPPHGDQGLSTSPSPFLLPLWLPGQLLPAGNRFGPIL
jgi:hypothetical protein